MPQTTGPRLLYSLEVVKSCMTDLTCLSLRSPIAALEDEDEKVWRLKEFCTPMLLAVQNPSIHFEQLDVHISTLLPYALNMHPSRASTSRSVVEDADTSQAQALLCRLPDVPQRLFALPMNNSLLRKTRDTLWDGIKDGRWASKYVLPEARSSLRLQPGDDPNAIMQLVLNIQDLAWNNLYVTSFVDTNTVVLIMLIASVGSKPDLGLARDFLSYIDTLAMLIDEYDSLVDAASFGHTEPVSDPTPSVQALKAALFPEVDDEHEQGRAILKAFLWATWQRSVMLYFYYIIGVQLDHGYSSTWNALLAVRGLRRLDDLDSEDYKRDSTNYLCNWAFELLRTSRSSLGLDFRTMIHRFNAHFGERTGRCINGSDSACDGDQPETCHRFTASETKAQSAHAATCDRNCRKIKWSEVSYMQSASPRAVVANKGQDLLHYCKVSSQTMAISHVWSHGQGGRPEEGLNACLHERYCSLAERYSCQSYWIDSACIPSDRALRKEAIATINDVFSTSEITLVSDVDLQSVDLTSSSIEALETLLSILFVCDWNVRAWTMLEAIRGSRAIYLQCKEDCTISLTEILRKVHQEGAIDLAVLVGSAQHLLPSSDSGRPKTIEEASYMLSQRHASHPDDEIRIWSLLNNGPGHKDILELWKSQSQVNTAFLMSSAPRITTTRGYGWAPIIPYIRPQTRSADLDPNNIQHYTVRYPSYDGQGSFIARIEHEPAGLISKWLVWDMDCETISTYREEFCNRSICPAHLAINPHIDPDTKVFEQPDTAAACDLVAHSLANGRKVRILRPLAEDGVTPYEGGSSRGEEYGLTAAICVSVDGGDIWEWRGVFQWLDASHPEWTVEEMIIV